MDASVDMVWQTSVRQWPQRHRGRPSSRPSKVVATLVDYGRLMHPRHVVGDGRYRWVRGHGLAPMICILRLATTTAKRRTPLGKSPKSIPALTPNTSSHICNHTHFSHIYNHTFKPNPCAFKYRAPTNTAAPLTTLFFITAEAALSRWRAAASELLAVQRGLLAGDAEEEADGDTDAMRATPKKGRAPHLFFYGAAY